MLGDSFVDLENSDEKGILQSPDQSMRCDESIYIEPGDDDP